jgi:hypothetical protein
MPKFKYENGEEKSPKNAPSSPSAPTTAKVSSSIEDITNSASTTLTTSTSSVPPPLIIPSTTTTTTQNYAFPDRIGQSFYSKNYFIHDQEQVKIHYQSYKTVFCSNATNKGFVLYRYNSLKKAKQVIVS